jgi:hypothetical protein
METSTETQYIKCKGCSCIRAEDEYEIYKGSRRKTCLKCKANRVKNKDKEKEKEYYKKYRENNKDKIKENNKKYRENNVDNLKEIYKKWRENNREKKNEYEKKYREANKCEHQKRKNLCKICNLEQCLINLQRGAIRRMLKNSDLSKTKHTIEYLGCDSEYFKEYITKKMNDDMTWDNIHLDHIRPISKFNLSDPDEFLECCHYTNLQPLLAKTNLEKSNKWDEFDENYWQENIKGKEYMSLYPF